MRRYVQNHEARTQCLRLRKYPGLSTDLARRGRGGGATHISVSSHTGLILLCTTHPGLLTLWNASCCLLTLGFCAAAPSAWKVFTTPMNIPFVCCSHSTFRSQGSGTFERNLPSYSNLSQCYMLSNHPVLSVF